VIQPHINFKKANGHLQGSFLIKPLFSLLSSKSSLLDEMCVSEIYDKTWTYKQISDMHIFYQEWSETSRRFNTIHFHRCFVTYSQKYSSRTRGIEIEWVTSDFVCADGVNIFVDCVKIQKLKTEALLVTSEEIGPQLHSEKTKYTLLPRQ
jgi:hypothetical protein